MLPFGLTIPATVPQGPEIPEGLMNNPVQTFGNTDYLLIFHSFFNFTHSFATQSVPVLTVITVGIPTCSQHLLTWFVRRPDDGHVRTETCSITHNKAWLFDENCFIVLVLIEGADIVRFIKVQRIKWLGHIQRMGQARPTRKLLDCETYGN